jgi:hypothetical protein
VKIFIDESGSFTGYHSDSIGAVGALAIPDRKLAFIEKSMQEFGGAYPRTQAK